MRLRRPCHHRHARTPGRAGPSVRGLASVVWAAAVAGLFTACAGSGTLWRAAADAEARRAIAQESQLDPSTYPVRAVAVLPFAGPATDSLGTLLGFAMGELVASDLQRTGRVLLIERARIDALLRELALASTQRVDPATAPRVGKLLGARRLVTGVVTKVGPDYRLNLRVSDVLTGQGTPIPTISLSPRSYEGSEGEALRRVLLALGIALSPDEVARTIRVTPLPSIPALTAFGRATLAQSTGDAAAAARGYRDARRADGGFRLPADRLADLRDDPTAMGSASPLQRAVLQSTDRLVPPAPARLADAVDAAGTNAQRLVSLVIRLGSP